MESPSRKILYVDDDEDTCEMLALFLQQYELTLAHTFADAEAKALSGTFDAILLDFHLPGGSGVELCRQIRESNIHIPIIFYSADALPERIEEAKRAGANEYLVKPFTPDNVGKAIAQLLS